MGAVKIHAELHVNCSLFWLFVYLHIPISVLISTSICNSIQLWLTLANNGTNLLVCVFVVFANSYADDLLL